MNQFVSLAVNETVPGGFGVGHATTESTGKAEQQGMNARFVIERGEEHVLIYNTVRTRIASCIHASCQEKKFNQEGRRALTKVDCNIVGIEWVSVLVAGREEISNQVNAWSRRIAYRPKTPPARPCSIADWVSTAV